MCSVESVITEEFGHKHICVVGKTSDIHECIFLCASLRVTTVLCPVGVAQDMPGPVGCVYCVTHPILPWFQVGDNNAASRSKIDNGCQ